VQELTSAATLAMAMSAGLTSTRQGLHMKYVRLGRSGMKVSQICLGCMSFGNESPWMVDGKAARRVLNRAWDLGINYFDTANEYSHGKSEEILGDYENQKGLSRKHVIWQIDESLRRLKMDYVDLYQTHRWDDDTEIAESLSVMTEIVHSGKVRYIGASSMWAW
jgi:aryl-alcohol dehydrogenase-like predicted oxidoreductase